MRLKKSWRVIYIHTYEDVVFKDKPLPNRFVVKKPWCVPTYHTKESCVFKAKQICGSKVVVRTHQEVIRASIFDESQTGFRHTTMEAGMKSQRVRWHTYLHTYAAFVVILRCALAGGRNKAAFASLTLLTSHRKMKTTPPPLSTDHGPFPLSSLQPC